jgi:hypothetical protein
MDTIAFLADGDAQIGVRILVNGRELIELVREIELPFATREGHPDLAGDYGYFGPMFVFSPARHFYGEPAHGWTDGPGRIFVLACSCGIPECWALSAHAEVGTTEVTWADFRQPYRRADSKAGEWRHDGLGPFKFDRRLYDRELEKTPTPPKPRPRTRNTELTEMYNQGFRRGANERAAAGISLSSKRRLAPSIPTPPETCRHEMEWKAWTAGYEAGHSYGASDAELASVDVPGAHGMISGFDQNFLERSGFLKGIPDENRPAQ